jgi:23S rRNA (cytidine1920-2'-O)/16S rRNA (cytidine1409-2'-O)-methyltransferase
MCFSRCYNKWVKKTRLDMLLVERGLAESRSIAQRLVMAGRVRIDGQPAFKPGMSVSTGAELSVKAGAEFVSRGGEKLEAAIQAFQPDIRDRVCADVGASTGGFTDCLLQHGAVKVYAIDVGHGILAWSLRQDARVVVMERQNARYIEKLPEPVSLITVDVSFISLKILLPVFKGWFFDITPQMPLSNTGEGVEAALTPQSPLSKTGEGVEEKEKSTLGLDSPLPALGEGSGVRGQVLALIKPQFEAGRAEVRHGEGVIRDPLVHRHVLLDVLTFAEQEGYGVKDLIRSPLLGPKGNTEFLAWLSYPAMEAKSVLELINQVISAHT